jgi:uncharacterized repeat protein (TIGR02543 family)
MKCPNCGKELQPNWKTCPSCGTEIIQPLKCPGCSRTLDTDWKSCPYCGKSVVESNTGSITIADSVVRELHQIQQTNIQETKGANVGGNININVTRDTNESRPSGGPEYQYEQFVIVLLQSGGNLERARVKLEQRREQLGLTLKQSKEIEAHCLTEVHSGGILAVDKKGNRKQGNQLLKWAVVIGVVFIVIVGVIVGVNLSNNSRRATLVPNTMPNTVSNGNQIVVQTIATIPSSTVPSFIATTYGLNISIAPMGGGTVSGGGNYVSGKQVTVQALPSPGYQFEGWSGSVSGTSTSISVTMNSDENLIATFAALQYTLSTSVNPSGGGTINPSASTTGYGQTVNLSATATDGYRFVSWSGDVSGSNSNISVTMNSNKQVFANFVKQVTLTITVNPLNTGNATPNTAVYDQGSQVTLIATPASGYQFDRWSGDISGTGSSIVVTVNSSMNVVANFGKAPLNVGPTAWNIGTGTGDLKIALNVGDILSFNFSVNVSGASAYYSVIGPNGDTLLNGSGGSKVMSGQGSLTATIPGNYDIHFLSSGIITSSIITYSYTVTYAQP